jgi:DnaJ-class molecular chaperone
MRDEEVCQKCKGTGMVKESDGSVHTCWDCMMAGRLNQHSDKLPDSKIKI